MDTLVLDVVRWDLIADASGNIAMATDQYSVAQDVASAIRSFQGECFYDTTLGIPYWSNILGEAPPVALMKAQFIAAANTVPGVANAVCYIGPITGRVLTGQVQVTDTNGNVVAVGLSPFSTFKTEYAITDTGQPGVTDTGQYIVVG